MLTTPWLARLDGVGAPLIPQRVAGAAMLSGFVCKPHDCMDNQVVYLFRSDGSRIVGLARLTTTHRIGGEDRGYRSELALGEPGEAELACLRTLLRGREGSDTLCAAN